jgi:hypothetical protein
MKGIREHAEPRQSPYQSPVAAAEPQKRIEREAREHTYAGRTSTDGK